MPYHRKTIEQFVKEAVQVHGDKYGYSEVEYVNTHKPVKIRCLLEKPTRVDPVRRFHLTLDVIFQLTHIAKI